VLGGNKLQKDQGSWFELDFNWR